MAAGLPEAAEAILRDLARAVSLHRRGGGALDALPARQQELLRAMDDAQRRVFFGGVGEAGEAAVRAAALAAGLAVAPHELRPLLEALGGRPPASDGALRAALLGVRRRAWRDRLAALAKGAEALPARPDDLDAAVASITDPEVGDAELLSAL